jgi:ribosome-binding factor A
MSRRVERVADEILHAVAALLQREIKDPRIGMVTLTGIKLSPDLRHARIFFSVIGDGEQRARSLLGLQSATGFVRGQLGRRLRLRVTPEITFVFDPSIEQAERVSRLLKEAGVADKDDERDPDR